MEMCPGTEESVVSATIVQHSLKVTKRMLPAEDMHGGGMNKLRVCLLVQYGVAVADVHSPVSRHCCV